MVDRCLREVWRHGEGCRVSQILATSSATSKQTRRSSALQGAIPDQAAKIDKDKAVEWSSKALEAGVQLNIKKYKAVIHACAKFGDMETMQRISLLCICYFVTDVRRSQGKKQENALQEQAAFLPVAMVR